MVQEVDARKPYSRSSGGPSTTSHRIAGIINFISAGDHSDYMRKALQDLEAQAKTEKAAIAALRQDAARPIELPTPAEVAASSMALAEVMEADPLRARESLRRLFEGGQLLLHPQPGGFYVAQGRIDVLAFLTLRFDASSSGTSRARTPLSQNPGSSTGPDHLWSSNSCAGRI
jgi:Arc/MetJ-type ribon-helix-helix transcriptional regulator